MPNIDLARRTPLGLPYPVDGEEAQIAVVAAGRHVLGDPAGTPELLLLDFTATERFGLKGRGSAEWLASRGFALPERINTMRAAGHGCVLARLGREDVILLPSTDHRPGSLARLREAWRTDPGPAAKGFDGWRDEVWAWFHVCGAQVATLMAKTCPVDLHVDRFPIGEVSQTRVAQMDCVVIRSDRTGPHGFDLLFDVSSSEFMLGSMQELAASW